MKLLLLLSISLSLCAGSWEYLDDIKLHKQSFLDWFEPYRFSAEYSRVQLTMSCEDADFIPKHPDAGKIFLRGENSYQMMHNGVKVYTDGYCGRWMTNLIYGLKGHHEPQEERVFYEVLKHLPAEATMIELGSYWGYYSLWFATTVQNPTNYLIEPALDYLALGKKNFALNGCKGNFIHGYSGNCILTDALFQGARHLRIDAFLEENHIEHLHILHSDIQGAEYDMLLSAEEALNQKKVDYFFISTHSEEIHKQCLNLLQSKGYLIIAEHTLAESYSADGLIVAKHPNIAYPEKIKLSKRS